LDNITWEEGPTVKEQELAQEQEQQEQARPTPDRVLSTLEEARVHTLDQITSVLDPRRTQVQVTPDTVRSILVEAEAHTLDQITSALDQITSVLDQIISALDQITSAQATNSTLVEAQAEVDRADMELTTVASIPLATAVRRRLTKAILSIVIAELAPKLPKPTISSAPDHSRSHGPSATPLQTGRKPARRRGSERKSARRRKRRRRNKLRKPK